MTDDPSTRREAEGDGGIPAAPPYREPQAGTAPAMPPGAPPAGAPPQQTWDPTAWSRGEQLPPPPRAEWMPPPKPGLIPLRPLGFGTLLGAPFAVLRRNPRATFGSALLVQGVLSVVSLAVVGLVSYLMFARVYGAAVDDRQTLAAGGIAVIVLSVLGAGALLIVGAAFLQGVIVSEVARGTLGERLRLGALWRRAARRLGALVLWVLAASAALLVALAVVAGLVTAAALAGGGFIVLAVLLGVLGFLALCVVGAWIGVKLSLVPSILVLERARLRTAIRRSWMLTTGYVPFWRTLGLLALIGVILSIANQVVSFALSFAVGPLTQLISPNGQDDTAFGITATLFGAAAVLLTIVVGAISSVVQSAAVAVVYIDLRMRREGLDLVLQRYVEEHQIDPGLPDPYLLAVRADGSMPA